MKSHQVVNLFLAGFSYLEPLWLCDEQCHAFQLAVTLTRLDCSVSSPHHSRFYQLSSKNYDGIFPYSPVLHLKKIIIFPTIFKHFKFLVSFILFFSKIDHSAQPQQQQKACGTGTWVCSEYTKYGRYRSSVLSFLPSLVPLCPPPLPLTPLLPLLAVLAVGLLGPGVDFVVVAFKAR